MPSQFEFGDPIVPPTKPTSGKDAYQHLRQVMRSTMSMALVSGGLVAGAHSTMSAMRWMDRRDDALLHAHLTPMSEHEVGQVMHQGQPGVHVTAPVPAAHLAAPPPPLHTPRRKGR
jgi:hypothetical protein